MASKQREEYEETKIKARQQTVDLRQAFDAAERQVASLKTRLDSVMSDYKVIEEELRNKEAALETERQEAEKVMYSLPVIGRVKPFYVFPPYTIAVPKR